MAGSKPVGSFTLLKTELKRIFDEGLLLSSYNIYSQFMPRQGGGGGGGGGLCPGHSGCTQPPKNEFLDF
jgi:hypothetical protein